MTLSCNPTEPEGWPPGVSLCSWEGGGRTGAGLGQGEDVSKSSCYGPAAEPCPSVENVLSGFAGGIGFPGGGAALTSWSPRTCGLRPQDSTSIIGPSHGFALDHLLSQGQKSAPNMSPTGRGVLSRKWGAVQEVLMGVPRW